MGPAAPVTGQPSSGQYPYVLGGVEVSFGGVPAPLLYVSANRVNSIVPFAMRGRDSAEVRLSMAGAVAGFPVAIADSIPGVFQQTDGTAAALNQDGSVNSAVNPAPAGSVVSMWVTGVWGSPAVPDGSATTLANGDGCCGVLLGSTDPVQADVLYAPVIESAG